MEKVTNFIKEKRAVILSIATLIAAMITESVTGQRVIELLGLLLDLI